MALAYCGLNCTKCSVYLASIKKDTSEQSRLAKEYSTATCIFSKEDIFCLGCQSKNFSMKICGGCEIRNCCIEKTCTNCAECNEFPCLMLEKYLGNNPDSLDNLKQLAIEYRKTE